MLACVSRTPGLGGGLRSGTGLRWGTAASVSVAPCGLLAADATARATLWPDADGSPRRSVVLGTSSEPSALLMIPAGVTDTPRRRDMSVTDELLQNNERYATAFDQGDLQLPPAKKLAVLACMDARGIPSRILGLDVGDAHIRLRDADLYRR
jgi:hypothetical protein